eukprot:scaffold122442_cov14-Tisochrysis_lutea.AAC.1
MLSLKSVYPQEELEAQKNLQVAFPQFVGGEGGQNPAYQDLGQSCRGLCSPCFVSQWYKHCQQQAGRPWLLHKLGSGKVQISSLSCL